MPIRNQYAGFSYDDPRVQAEFQRLLDEVDAAEQARAPIQQQHRQAENSRDAGSMSDAQFGAVDRQFIAANNKIAAAKRKVDHFLSQNKDYRVR